MIHLKKQQSVYENTKDYPELRSILVEFGFGPLSNDAVYKTMGAALSFSKAIEHIHKTPEMFCEFAKENHVEVCFDE